MTSGPGVPAVLDHEIRGPGAWTRADVSPGDFLVPFGAGACAELDTVAAELRRRPRPVEELAVTASTLPGCAAVMTEVRARLTRGPGMAIVERIPVERYEPAEIRAVAWLLASMLGPIVGQKWGGTRIYDVRDSGQALGPGVRRSVTNLDQPFHTDGPWLTYTPAFVGLFCVEPARGGGRSRLVSLLTAHNGMRRRHPRLLPRLYQPFRWDRQAEHGPGDTPYSTHPIFDASGGTLSARYYEDYVVKGQALAADPLDDAGREALTGLRALVDDEASWIEFRLERGQFQYVNNRQFAHSRTAFRDDPAGPPRHMLRVWNRPEGGLALEG